MKTPSPRKTALIVGTVVTLLLGGVVLFMLDRFAEPTVNIPPRPGTPSPNAYDVFLEAADAMVREKEVADAVGLKTAAGTSVAKRAELVAANRTALATARRGLPLPYLEPIPVRSIHARFPYYARFRALTRLLVLEGQVHLDRGDGAAALNSFLDAQTLGRKIPNATPLIGRLVGVACETIGRYPVWRNLERFDAPALRSGVRRLEGIVAQGIPFAETVTEEKYFVQVALLESFENPSGAGLGDPEEEPTGQEVVSGHLGMSAMILQHGKRGMMENLTRGMDQLIREAGQPYGEAKPVPLRDSWSRLILEIYPDARARYEAGEAQNALLLAAMALRAYRLEKGRYPGSLDALAAAGYLAGVPRDPFGGAGDALRYRTSDDNYVLYSLGPDGADDGGEPIEDPKAPGNAGRSVLPDSTGDIVAGVNY